MDTYIDTVCTEILSELSVANIVTVIATVVALGIGFVAMWWAVRYGVKKLMAAIKKGRASV